MAKPTASEDSAYKRNGDATYAAAVKSFETGVRYFQKHKYERAKEVFEKLADTAPLGIADRAKVHLRLCSQRLAPLSKPLKTAEDYYVAGVSALNARRLDRAVECLAKSARLDAKREETHYTLAAAYALQGMADRAMQHLKISIQLRPQNLFQARADEDLRRLSSDPRFNNLLRLEPTVAARPGA
jgi:tetratricopeptide (TPR) repeat protein